MAFANQAIQDELDYLFIDEAGQVSIANLVGMSQSTSNIVLIGDQTVGTNLQGIHRGFRIILLILFSWRQTNYSNDIGILCLVLTDFTPIFVDLYL